MHKTRFIKRQHNNFYVNSKKVMYTGSFLSFIFNIMISPFSGGSSDHFQNKTYFFGIFSKSWKLLQFRID